MKRLVAEPTPGGCWTLLSQVLQTDAELYPSAALPSLVPALYGICSQISSNKLRQLLNNIFKLALLALKFGVKS